VSLWKADAVAVALHYGFRMRTAPALVLSLAVVLSLGACVADEPVVLPDESPSSQPIFASDEEALAAAEEAYGAYLAASDEVLSKGGASAGQLLVFFSDGYGAEAIAGYELYIERGWRATGSSAFDSAELQQYIDDGDGNAEVAMYVCLDVSGLRIIDETGADVTPERDNRLPLEVRFVNSRASTALVQSGSDIWAGADFCS
jgi:hypothetical protein